jgi:hypothetical protein
VAQYVNGRVQEAEAALGLFFGWVSLNGAETLEQKV